MGWLRRLANRFDPPEARSHKGGITSRDPYLQEFFGLRDIPSGQIVTPERATSVAAVHACVQLIAETAASLPLAPYRRLPGGGREIDRDHPLFRVLHDQANRRQTAYQFREQLTAACLLTGNGYAGKVIDGAGRIRELLPLHPEEVYPSLLTNGRIGYDYSPAGGSTGRLTQDEVLHLAYRTRDGVRGLSPITIARETIGTALAEQQFQGRLWRNSARPSGALVHPGRLSDESHGHLKRSFEEQFSGPENAGRLMVLEEGLEFKPLAMNLQDAEFIASRKLTLNDIARIFRVPPPAIGILDDATYSNITEQQRSLVVHTIRPWVTRIEQAMNMALLTEAGRRTHFIEHDLSGLLRGDHESRMKSYATAITHGIMSPNETRQRENLNPREGGDEFLSPMNMRVGGAPADKAEAA